MACSNSSWRSSCQSVVEMAVASSSAGGVAVADVLVPGALLAAPGVGVGVEEVDAMGAHEKERRGRQRRRLAFEPGRREATNGAQGKA